MQRLSSDQPLEHPKGDVLGYAPFAENLARSLRQMIPTEGLVIGLNGPWGSGKTTVLNFTRHYLDEQEEQSAESKDVIWFRFTPWWFSGREDLTRRFFDQMRAKIGSEIPAIKEHLANFGEAISSVPTEYLELLPYVGSVAGLLKQSGDMLKEVRQEEDVVTLKQKVVESLRDEGRKIVVVIDDVDRLTPDEIRMLFRTIKAIADFPNVVYLLAFDRSVVRNALTQNFEGKGEEYLEKIVQVSFHLPPIEDIGLREMLLERLEAVMGGAEGHLDQQYWTDVYFSGIDQLIKTPRHVVRLINALQVSYPAVEGEVNPADFIAVEAIRTFETEVYRLVRENPDLLTGRPNGGTTGNLFGDEGEARFDSWLDAVSDDNRNAVKSVLSKLFPKFAAEYGGSQYGKEFERKWRNQRRICSPDVFPVYFRLSVPGDAISEQEMREWLALADDPEDFGQRLLEFADQERRDGTTRARVAIDRLDDYAHEELQAEYASPLIEAIFRVGSDLLAAMEGVQGMMDFGADIRVGRVLVTLLRRLDETERLDVLEEVISEGGSVSLAQNLTVVIGQQHGEFGADPSPERDRLIDEDGLNQLKQIVVDRIREMADADSLLDEPEFWSILGLWRDLTDDGDEVREWVESAVDESDEALVRLLESAKWVVRSQTMGSHAFSEQPRLDPQKLEPYLDPDEIIDRVRDLADQGDLSEGQRVAVQQFIEEYELRQEGEDPDAHYRRPE